MTTKLGLQEVCTRCCRHLATRLEPTLCLVLGVASVTREAIAREATRLGGVEALVLALEFGIGLACLK